MTRQLNLDKALVRCQHLTAGLPTFERPAKFFYLVGLLIDLLMDQQQTVEIDILQTENEYRTFMIGLEEGIAKFAG